jgi:hypothetical protein
MISIDRAARRYLQIAAFEETVRLTEAAILDVEKEIEEAEARRAELRRTKRDALEDIRKAARDEGQLPLFENFYLAQAEAPLTTNEGARA